MKLRDMKGLGPKSESQLKAVGIDTPAVLGDVGAVEAFRRLAELGDATPSLNFLYAMVGALEDRHWAEIAREERERLLNELEGYRELDALFVDDA
ncbi:MAG: TfoX/Sxy family protein [Woeseiaceae bacterium]|nr:TfoX/Sxy family protein [Woeseiaceae bacterium]